MNEPEPKELLELAIEAAQAGGRLLRERFAAGGEAAVTSKSTPTDLVSQADLASQQAIRALIGARRPKDGFLAEEESADDAGSSGLQWIVDPLDGTVNYLYGIPIWCVSIAVRDAAGMLAGVVFDPLGDETFSAVRGEPPLLNAAPLRPARERAHTLAQALVATGFAYDGEVRAAQAGVVSHSMGSMRDIRRCGAAALDLAWTAAGRFDAYFERTVKIWDTAAGALICESAGLEVHELSDRPGLPGGILAAPPELAGPLLELVG